MSVQVNVSLWFVLRMNGRLSRTRLGLPEDALPDYITVDDQDVYLTSIVGNVAHYSDIQLLLD